MANKQVQIDFELFKDIYSYFVDNAPDSDIMHRLDDKLTRMIDREVFTKYKRASTDAEREQYRRQYLDRKGIPQAFRSAKEMKGEFYK